MYLSILFLLYFKTKEGLAMTDKERYEKYINEICRECKNKETDLCNIRIFTLENIIFTKCVYYGRKK
jgi:hypothetical protein